MRTVNEIISSLSNPYSKNKGSIYFIGIGGIGMSALARYFNSKKIKVSGYDKTETELTKQLIKEGIAIHYEDDVALIDREAQLVIYTPAIPQNHKELNHYRQNTYTIAKRSEVLGAITNTLFNICVAGTHGKTTTSTMLAHILTHSGYGCNAFLGGIAVNYNSNFWSSNGNTCVIEADEYDRSFLQLNPDIAIIGSMDPDHLDIYGTAENMEQAFIDFSHKIKPGGLLLSKYGLKRHTDLNNSHHLTYVVGNKKADIYAQNIIVNNGSYRFDVIIKNESFKNVVLNMGGEHNIENAIAAMAVAHHLKIDGEKIKAAIESFRGVKRRFEYIIKNERRILIDDYAHHPGELAALLSGTRSLFPGKKCTIIFQPHLYSRTRDFVSGFAKSLDLADEIILLPIYPARELPIAGVNSEMIMDEMEKPYKQVLSKEELLEWVKRNESEVLITAGAGDIDLLVEPIKNIMEENI